MEILIGDDDPERLLLHAWGTASAGERQLRKQLAHRLRQKRETVPTQPGHSGC